MENNMNNANDNSKIINNMNQMVNICNSMNTGDNSFAQFGMVLGAGIEGGADSMPMHMAAMLGGISMMNNPNPNMGMNNTNMGMNNGNMMNTAVNPDMGNNNNGGIN
ncbi:MAG: hypothetical protein IJD02_01080 [Lachnospiraceae bacterium]|nr:hypothetical protein [Lachnospiraceae bacterium]